jgi:hypothetical protein
MTAVATDREPRFRAAPLRPLLLTLALALGACGEETDPIRRLVANAESAVEARDAEAVAGLVTQSFRGPDGIGRAELLSTLRRSFLAYESIDMVVYDVSVERGEASAQVSCIVELSGDARRFGAMRGLLPPEAVYRLELEIADEDGAWRIAQADWEAIQPPG